MADLMITVRGENVEVSEAELKQYREKGIAQFEKYLDLIANPEIRAFAEHMLQKAPNYFYIIPASVSGKWHAPWSTDKGGLVRHVLMGCQVAYDLSRTFGLTDKETDMALAAMIGHDIIKYGLDFDDRYMDMHPFMPRSYYGHYKSEGYVGDYAKTPEFDTIMSAIERHMGNIMTGEWTSVGGVRPETPLQYVVHLADYVASRKNLVHTDFISGYQY
ncbi:HD domain-containing protein [Bacillus licheniformis]|uniref:HD domain-containing protein n=1 Tax=Bacillus TaxID=1386 RepID=UPI002280313E|nr:MULTISPECIES: HD domain-containing protein [Bacillus]MCY7861194.1 HD domain-containing protein [Bacillus haynesii]MCY8291477.1 HD domain-containing protein [Bacillus haynesii]MCY8549100.1 HD domain-containing protein [Bacillus haynesii]MCY8745151.1 HD domain-containing protein [Bacillus licheniformis]